MSELERLAKLVAIEAPESESLHALAAKIPWSTVTHIRVELERQGFDWRRATRHRIALEEVQQYERLYGQAVRNGRAEDMKLYAARLDAARERLGQFK
jgi:hypothetical protein